MNNWLKADWIVKHSVNCYFCGELFDERDGHPADTFNSNDGGEVCPDCEKIYKEVEGDNSEC